MKKWKEKAAALSLTGILLFNPAAALAADDDDTEALEAQLEDLQMRADAQQAETERIQGKIDSVSEQLRVLSMHVSEAEAEYAEVQGALEDTEGRIAENQELLEKTQKELNEKSGLLRKRVRNIYMHGQISYIDVLFGAKSFNDFLTRMDLLTRIIKADYNLLKKVQEDKRVVEKARAALETERKTRIALVRDAASKRAELRSRKREKDDLLERMENDKALSQQAYEEMLAASKEVEKLIQARRYQYRGPAVVGAGGLMWPIASDEITSDYGWRAHPITGDSRYHSGVDIGGDYGEPIYAAAAGTVVYAGWISGYGYAVVIDHGGGISTLYGHNEQLNVGEGQNVSQGDVIAYCGSTGNSTGPHCHFEVRENGEPVDPMGYF